MYAFPAVSVRVKVPYRNALRDGRNLCLDFNRNGVAFTGNASFLFLFRDRTFQDASSELDAVVNHPAHLGVIVALNQPIKNILFGLLRGLRGLVKLFLGKLPDDCWLPVFFQYWLPFGVLYWCFILGVLFDIRDGCCLELKIPIA